MTRFKKRYKTPELSRVFQHILATDTSSIEEFPSFVKIKSWLNERVVLLGDAAHAMPLDNWQAPSMAVEDAFLLGTYLADEPSFDVALQKWLSKRFPRVFYVQKDAIGRIKAAQKSSFTGFRDQKMKIAAIFRAPQRRLGKLIGDANELK